MSDPRYYQIICLALFLLLGLSSRDWTVRQDFILAAFASCLATQFFWSWRLKASFASMWPSSIITALGLCLLLRGNHPMTMMIAGILAISSKFVCKSPEGKHFFNPANFGIISALVLTNDAWVSPGQWGTDWWYFLLFLGTGGIIVKKVGRWDTSVTFLLTYTLLLAIRNTWLGWDVTVIQHQLTSGSLLLFALFMITDPRSIPNATSSRLVWSVALAILTVILQQFYRTDALFWSLFVLSPLTVILDRLQVASPFNWKTPEGQLIS